jgi:hypothetical protein
MVEFIHGVVALLAGLILVLTALVGWLYLQQSRMSHAINALAVAVTAPPPSFMYSSELPPENAPLLHEEQQREEGAGVGVVDDLDDRLSVHDLDAPAPSEHIVEQVEQPAPEVGASTDDDVAGKTVAQLRDMLTAKGIPFNKSDKKSTLVSLVQVSA